MAKNSEKDGFDEVIRRFRKRGLPTKHEREQAARKSKLRKELDRFLADKNPFSLKGIVVKKMLKILQRGKALSTKSLIFKTEKELINRYNPSYVELYNCVWGLLLNPNVVLTSELKYKWVEPKEYS